MDIMSHNAIQVRFKNFILVPFALSFFILIKKYRRVKQVIFLSSFDTFYYAKKLRRTLRTNGTEPKIYYTYVLNRTYIYTIFFLLSVSCIHLHSFHYDSAAQALHKGDFNRAYELLKPLVVDNPERSDILYDAGVAAYN